MEIAEGFVYDIFYAGKDLREKHPGFSSTIKGYQYQENKWKRFKVQMKANQLIPVTTNLVQWRGNWIIPGGEIKPGIRTPAVLKIYERTKKSAQ